SWRLTPLTDDTAWRLRWFPLVLALAIVLGGMSTRLLSVADASLASTWVLNGLAALTNVLVLGTALAVIGRARREADDHGHGDSADEPAQRQATPLWLPTVRVLTWVVLAAAALAVFSGYISLGGFIVG